MLNSRMEYRKLIKFGNSSHVVSLPKSWTEKNNLKKGDTIYLEENGNNELILLSKEKDYNENPIREIVIETDRKDLKLINREIVAAYLNDYNIIKLIGNDIIKHSQEIREMVHKLMACEVIEQNGKYIVCRDFLRVSELSLIELTRKMDNIVRAMFFDIQNNSSCDIIHFKERCWGINRISFVTYRMLKTGLIIPSLSKRLAKNNFELCHWWFLTSKIEHIAEDLRDLSTYLSTLEEKKFFDDKQFMELIGTLIRMYEYALKSFYKNDHTLALTISDLKYVFEDKCEAYLKQYPKETGLRGLIERFKILMKRINSIAREVYSN